jgi:hypothetical protein
VPGTTVAAAPSATPSPAVTLPPSPQAAPTVGAEGEPFGIPTAPPTPEVTPNPNRPLYDVTNEIFTVDRDTQWYYYFQSNPDGTAKIKDEFRYGRNLWTDPCAQMRIRIPFITKYPAIGNPYAGLGNMELGYGYYVKGSPLDHSLEARLAFPTEVNNVDSIDWILKGFYTTKWKWTGGAVSYVNEYDQTIIRPPGASYTSYYEGKLSLPDYVLIPGANDMKFSAIYNYRVLFDSGGILKSAVGGTIFGGANDVAVSITDTWGLGEHGLWRYKFEANLTVRF